MSKNEQLLIDIGLSGGKATLNQPIYFKNVLTSEVKSGNVLHLTEVMPLLP